MTPSDVPHIAHHYLQEFGLADRGWTFAWDRARRRAGCCKYYKKTISLSRHYVEMNVYDRPLDVVDTVLHEIAHALTPGYHHGPAWQAMCLIVGANPKRCYDSSTVEMPKGKLVATCGWCGKQFRRHKRLRRGHWAYCTACGPERGRLEFRDTTTTTVISGPSTATFNGVPLGEVPPPPQPKRLR